MRKLLIIFVLSSLAHAATITSNASLGAVNWASGGTWVGGVAPGVGDSAVIASGTFVTIPVSTSVSTLAISCSATNGTGTLTVNGTLSLGGALTPCNSNWIANAGAVLHCTSGTSCPVVPATGTSYIFTIAGTSASRVTFDRTTTGTWKFTTQLWAVYADFSFCGAAGDYCAFPPAGTAASIFFFQHSTCDHCSTIGIWSTSATTNVGIQWSSFTNPTATNQRQFEFYQWNAPSGTYIRSFTNNYWEEGMLLVSTSDALDIGLSFNDNFCYAHGTQAETPCLNTVAGGNPKFSDGEWNNNLLWYNTTSGIQTAISNIQGGYQRGFVSLSSNPGQCPGGNNHYNSTIGPDDQDATFDGFYAEWDCGGAVGGGTFILHPSSTTTPHYTFKNGIVNGGSDGVAGPLIAVVTNGSTWLCDGVTIHCPVITGDQITANVANGAGPLTSSLYSGENNVPTADLFTITNNIFFRETNGTSGAASWFGAVGTLAAGTWSFTNNAKYNLSDDPYSKVSPSNAISPAGTNDQTGNPVFGRAPASNKFINWCQSLDGTITNWTDCGARFASQTSGFTVQAFLNYVREGFRPSATFIKTMSTTGGYVGAVPPAPTPVSADNLWVGDVQAYYPNQAQPAKGASYTDSRLNVPVTRITNAATDNGGSHPGGYFTNYSTNNPLSNDGAYLIFPFCNSQDSCDAQFSIFNASTYAFVKDIPASSVAGWNGVNAEPRWDRSGTANNIIYYRKNTQLRSYNMTNDADTLVTDFFTAYGAGGNNSLPLIAATDFIYTGEKGNTTLDSRYWAFIVRDGATTFQDKYIVTYDIQHPATLVSILDISGLATITHDLDISPYSDYVLIGAAASPSVCPIANLSSCFTVDSALPHNWWAKTAQGHTVLVGLDKLTDTEMMVRPDNQSFYILYCQGNNGGAAVTSCQNTTHYLGYGNGGGVLGQNGDLATSAPSVSGWAFFSTYSWECGASCGNTISFIQPVPPVGKVFGGLDLLNYWSSNNLFALELDETKFLATKTTYNGSLSYTSACTQGVNCPRIWQVAQLQNAVDNDYYFKQPNAVCNFAGTKCWWGGNWKSASGAMDVYQVNLPTNWVADLAGTTPATQGITITGGVTLKGGVTIK